MPSSIRDSQVAAAVALAPRPTLPRQPTPTVLYRNASSGRVATLATLHEAPNPMTQPRTTAGGVTTRWQRIKHRTYALIVAPKAPPAPTPRGGWVQCVPPAPLEDVDGLRAGYQVRTTSGLDIVFGVALPDASATGIYVTQYRDLGAIADTQP